MAGMYAILVEDLRAGGMALHEATERVDEMLLPVREQKAAANRRAFGHLLEAAQAAKARAGR